MDAASSSSASTPTPTRASLPRGSFDDVYRANGSGLLSVASSSSLSLSAAGDKAPTALDDDDAVMSDENENENDAMSETSSLEAIALDANDAMDLLLDDHEHSHHHEDDHATHTLIGMRKTRPASFHGMHAILSSPSSASPSPHHQHHQHQHSQQHPPPPRHVTLARASSLDATYSPSSMLFGHSPPAVWDTHSTSSASTHWPLSPRKRKRKSMLLHCHFASAMTKSVERGLSSPHPQLVDGEADDDLMDGASGSPPTCHNDRDASLHSTRQQRFAKVEWAHGDSSYDDRDGCHLVAAKNQVVGTQLRVLSNAPFQLTTDRANVLLAHGHAPRCRVCVDTACLPQAIQVEVLLIGSVEDERGDRVLETLERRTSSPSLALEHVLYIRVRVGDAAISGAYEIPVRLFTQHAGFTDEELSWTTTLHLRIARVTLPPPSQTTFHLDLWQHHASIARAHGGVPLWSDAHFTLLDRYFASLAELGQKCLTVVATEMPWAGQQCYLETTYPSSLFEHAVLEVYEDENGTLSIDFQYFDRLLALAHTHYMDKEIEVFGLFSIWRDDANGFDSPVQSATAVARPSDYSSSSLSPPSPPLDAARKPSTTPTSSSKHEKALDSWRIRCVHRTTQRVRYLHTMAEIECFVALFYAHCLSHELVDRVRVCADEPSDLPLFHTQMQWLARLAPQLRVKVALNHFAFLEHAPAQVVDFVPLLPLVCADQQVTDRWRRHIHAAPRHGRLCWYVCCGPSFPNQFVSSPLCESELVGFLTHFLGLDGFLRWNFCLWPSTPWQSLTWRSPSWRVGDMYFVLPGLDGYPVETLRFEGMRFAVQSYELLQLAAARLPAAEFERLQADVASLVWRSPGHAAFGRYLESGQGPEDLYSLDPLDYEQARRLLIDALALAESLEPSEGPAVGSEEPETPASRPTSPRKRSFHGP